MREPCPAAFSFRTFNERAQITNGKVTDRTLWLICLGPIMEQAIAPIAKPGSAVVLRHAGHNISEQGRYFTGTCFCRGAARMRAPRPLIDDIFLCIVASAGFRKLQAESVKNSFASETRRQPTTFRHCRIGRSETYLLAQDSCPAAQ